MELDHTLKREIIPDDMFYKCAILQKKIEAREVFVSRVQTGLSNSAPDLEKFPDVCLSK
jgi:hypothetical protein